MEDHELSKIIITEAVRCSQGRFDSGVTAKLAFVLGDAEGRNRVYQCCLDLAQDSGRRQRIMMLLVNYVHSFPPSRRCLEKMQRFCKAHSSGDVSQDLLKLVDAHLREAPLEGLSSSILLSSRQGYASEFALVADFSAAPRGDHHSYSHHNGGGDGSSSSSSGITAPTVPVGRWIGVSIHKNEGCPCYKEVAYQRVWCPPYVEQFPLLCLESTVQRQVAIMSTFSANYKTNPAVMQATLFFMKQLCDSYVAKLLLTDPHQHFRSATICYLPMLLDMMESDYLCVRNHVYDFIFNLGVHVQLLDPTGVYAGCTEALEQEVIWVLLTVMERQAVLRISDETTWMTAAKCLLAVVPPCYRHLADCRTLFQILQLPGLWALHPETYTVLAQAFARSLLSVKDVDVAAEDNLVVDEAAFAKLGTSAMSDILAVYRHCVTPGARKALFQLLLACAARQHSLQGARGSGRPPGRLSSEARAVAFRDLISVDFFWYAYPLLFYASDAVQRALPRRIADSFVKADFDGAKKNWNVVLPLVEHMLRLMAQDAELESFIQLRFKTVEALRQKDEATFVRALEKLLEEVAETIPLLLEEQYAVDGTRTLSSAWRLLFAALRWAARHLTDEMHRRVTERLARKLVLPNESRSRNATRVRLGDLFASLLFSFDLLCRVSSQRDAVTFRTMLEVFLFDSGEATDVRTAMAFYHHLIEYLCTPSQSSFHLHRVHEQGDMAALFIHERAFHLSATAAQLVGLRVLWGTYRTLVSSQEAAVCCARHVLILLLCHQSTIRRGVEVRTWRTVLFDPYPPVALLAAQKIVGIVRAEEKFTSAAADFHCDFTRDVYHDAMRILEKGQRKRLY